MIIALLIRSKLNQDIKFNNVNIIMFDSSPMVEQDHRQPNKQNNYNQKTGKKIQEDVSNIRNLLQPKHITEQSQYLKSSKKIFLQEQYRSKKKIKQYFDHQKLMKNIDTKPKTNNKEHITLKRKTAELVTSNIHNKQLSGVLEDKKSIVYNLLNSLASNKITPNIINNNMTVNHNNHNMDVNSYLSQITNAIQNHFYNVDTYTGKSCDLRIQMSSDGVLIDVKAERGDSSLCQAAIIAAKQAQIPIPPSKEIYEIVKNIPIRFKPK